ncbi:hypothetical protein SRIMHP_30470 [Streptomyces rimosus subsp. rimosus]|uniref:Uncharacterized protein n=1 Tax=Streptomyces rimosus subsp. rimosus TaxID=132474 RepID=A0ABY3ZA60_STRRM|nr:hypothetical protein CTZ40_33000 [Streptomyces rimosus]QTL89983.1 hypothetical protein FMM49_33520 [Streptomyces rimosus subsp. rimosus]QEV79127.1 hypothetical protein CP984_32965 [Streptomyces rimosus]UNZ07003.1 hypothetical protein SRIMR7_33100 [Streptomyces rimosus subsp. rimosus]UTH98457.1 hypothetical protein SRIMHP_30470 [Streptomyces rimosus subsp. rimosus]
MSAPTVGTETLSAECTLAKHRGYEDLHGECRQTGGDVPLPHSYGLLLVRRCGCACHRERGVAHPKNGSPRPTSPKTRSVVAMTSFSCASAEAEGLS